MLEQDLSYFLKRAAEELAAAEAAASPLAAEAHRELARRFALMIDDVPGSPQPPTEVSSPAA